MKKFSLILLLNFASFCLHAQGGSWIIKLNGREILSAAAENEKANTRSISARAWKKKGSLEIRFHENEPNTWRRSFQFYDAGDNQLLSRDSVVYTKIRMAELRRIFGNQKEIRIYTVISPLDPSIAIKIRRMHLCTLRLP